MRVKARAVIWIDGRVIVAEQTRGGRKELSLPGGRVRDHESVTDAVKREVAEETGLQVIPDRLLYVAEVAQSVIDHDLELIFRAHIRRGVPRLNGFQAIDPDDGERPVIRPPLLDQIARDVASGWRDTPRWLGVLGRLR